MVWEHQSDCVFVPALGCSSRTSNISCTPWSWIHWSILNAHLSCLSLSWSFYGHESAPHQLVSSDTGISGVPGSWCIDSVRMHGRKLFPVDVKTLGLCTSEVWTSSLVTPCSEEAQIPESGSAGSNTPHWGNQSWRFRLSHRLCCRNLDREHCWRIKYVKCFI